MFPVMYQEPLLILDIKLQMFGGECGGVDGDGLSTVEGNKDVLVNDISEDILAVVAWMVEKLVDCSSFEFCN